MAAPKHDPTKDLAFLRQVDKQITESKTVDKSARMTAQHWHNWGDKVVNDLVPKAGQNGMPSADELELVSKVLHAAGDALNPLASMPWTQEQVTATAERVRAFLTLGFIEDDEDGTIRELVDTFTSTRKVPGAAKVYPDRPARIVVITKDGTVITEQVGNTENSVGNTKSRIIQWLGQNDVTVTDDQKKAIGEAVRQSVTGNPLVSLLDFGSIVHKNDAV